MLDIIKIADEADMIVNGYAFTRCDEGFRILNLNSPDREISKIQGFIKDNYKAMYMKWSEYSRKGYYKGNN